MATDAKQVLAAEELSGSHRQLLAQLDKLERLPKNWDGYGAVPIDLRIIQAAKEAIRWLPEPLPAAPQVVPMTHGRLQLEWHQGTRSLELEFESPTQVHYLKWAPSLGVEEEAVLPVTAQAEITGLVDWFMAGLAHG